MNKAVAPGVVDAKIVVSSIDWCVLHYTPGIQRQAIISKQILSKSPTELEHVERTVFIRDVYTQNLWTLELGCQEGVNVPM